MKKKIIAVLLSAAMAVSAVMLPQNCGNITYAEATSGVKTSDHWMSEKKPYQYTEVTEYLAGKEKYFTIGGTSYDEGYVFYLWNAARTSQVLYNLKGEYDNFSFDVGHVDNTTMYTADLKIYLDGELTETVHLTPSDISKRVSIDVSGVKQLKIKMTSDEALNHYDITYGVYNGSFTKNTYVAEEIPLSNIVGNKEPYQTDGDNTGVVRSKDKESFFMAGDEYTDCLKMYLWNPARSSKLYFNFDGDYESMTFLFGHIDNTTRVPATLSIELYGNVVVLDSGARGATTSFVENGQGDVLLAWENEAFLSLEEHPGEYEIVVPSVSILCQPTVAVVDEVAKKHGTEEIAEEYLNYLYSDEAQEIEAQNYYRPSTGSIYDEYVTEYEGNTITEIPEDGKWINDQIELTNIEHFGGWAEAREKHFADGAYFDQIYEQ